jgi:hypothetical protein
VAELDATIQEVVKRWDESQGHHGAFVKHYERGERAYRGVLSAASEAAKWRHKYHPPYAFNLIETIVSNTVEQNLRINFRPAPHYEMTPQEAYDLCAKTEDIEDLIRHEHRVDDMDAKQRPLYLTASIGGRGVLKSYWNYTTGAVKRQGVKMEAVDDGLGGSISVPTIQEITEEGVLRDHSTTEVVDPRDFVVHESARSLDPWSPGGAQYCFHRCWYSFEQLKTLEASGFLSNVDELKDAKDQSQSEYRDRGSEVFKENRQKDLIEVLEYWKFEDGQVWRAYVGNRKVLLRQLESNPFWHGSFPFTVCSSMPQPFTTVGMSDIELIAELQEMLWELGNHRLDNTELIANAIFLIRSDVQDPDAFEFYPGARWPVEDPAQVQSLAPPYQLIDSTLNAEGLIKGDLQTVTSAAPFAGGADSQTVDNKTATGASIVMNAAQQRLTSKKWESQQALKREAWMRLKNIQQFATGDKLVHILGKDGAVAFKSIDVLDIQGEYIAELEPMSDAQMRQEKQAEAMQLGQVLMAWAPLAAAAGAPLSVEEIIKWVFRRWDIDDSDRFFSAAPQPQVAGQQQPGGQQGPGGPPAGPNLGVTASSATDASSPSAAGGISGSPVQALARALAMSGGIANDVRGLARPLAPQQ